MHAIPPIIENDERSQSVRTSTQLDESWHLRQVLRYNVKNLTIEIPLFSGYAAGLRPSVILAARRQRLRFLL
ncbi:protein of unknown function [Methylocaldum szegediense]|uniref:Uncharacterized protein n=1 Tax=Methylocaldum szegediense TaxID=73780 RepID=A0ABM9I255_9GAMM|nr:protein of unknown function [Methylocaldum szegediense]